MLPYPHTRSFNNVISNPLFSLNAAVNLVTRVTPLPRISTPGVILVLETPNTQISKLTSNPATDVWRNILWDNAKINAIIIELNAGERWKKK